MDRQDQFKPFSHDPAILLEKVTKTYGEHIAVNELQLTVARGEVFGLLGPNGAGKTTTILMMLGLTEPASGSISVLGMNPQYESIGIKRRVGYMADDIGFYEDRDALDNLMYTARLNGIGEKVAYARAMELLEKVGLADASRKKTGAFSRGMRQRLGLADVLIKQPDMIILDEPTLGIDPEGVRELLELITALSREEGLTVLLSSHHLHQVQQVCDRVGLFVNGKLIACGNIDALSRELIDSGSIMVELEVAGWSDALRQELIAMDGVLAIEAGDGVEAVSVTVTCDRDMTAEIARVAAIKAQLLKISKREYGLDEIYHRYFEGGERNAVSN
ncbi:ABC transporter ATP-binding protein [Paenibacillus chungangensis]|uniref:ABC transporter ATP-binding protein n=1 Tax=Paenibacillus chungangensis TaxID=696535 RepID=A0ABW3HXL0_9BACL